MANILPNGVFFSDIKIKTHLLLAQRFGNLLMSPYEIKSLSVVRENIPLVKWRQEEMYFGEILLLSSLKKVMAGCCESFIDSF